MSHDLRDTYDLERRVEAVEKRIDRNVRRTMELLRRAASIPYQETHR